jgi:hypothetical protein
MALVLADRVKETTTSTGTGTITLAGASTGYQSFAVIGNGNTTYYTIAGQGTSEWEVGIGTYTSSGTTLSRDTVLASSNAGALVTFSAGTKDVFVTQPSEVTVVSSNNSGTSGQVLTSNGTGTAPSWQAATGAVTSVNTQTGVVVLSATDVGALPITGGAVTGATSIDTSSTSAALRVTQRGTGNAILVEDSTNPDSTPFIVDSAGRVKIGTTATTTEKLYVSGAAYITDTLGLPENTGSVGLGNALLTSTTIAGGVKFEVYAEEIYLAGVDLVESAAPFKAAGLIESASGGFKFPDGTTQTTAATGGGGTMPKALLDTWIIGAF